MCKCTPGIGRPWCGRGNCQPPTPGLEVLNAPSQYDRFKTRNAAASQVAYQGRLTVWLRGVQAEAELSRRVLERAALGDRHCQLMVPACTRMIELMKHIELAIRDYSNFDVTGTRPDETSEKPDNDGAPARRPYFRDRKP